MFKFSRWRLPLLAIIMIGVELTTFDNSVTVLGWLNPSPSNYFLAASLVGLFIFTVVGATSGVSGIGRRYLTGGTALLLFLQALINLLAEYQFVTKQPPLIVVDSALFTSNEVSLHILTIAYGAGLGVLSLIAWKAFSYIMQTDQVHVAKAKLVDVAPLPGIDDLQEPSSILRQVEDIRAARP